MKNKKLVTIVLVLSMILLNVMPTFAYTNVQELHFGEKIQVGDYKIELVVDTEKYSKMMFTNILTGEKEYLEEYNENGKTKYIATSPRGKHVISIENDFISIKDDNTNCIQYLYNKTIENGGPINIILSNGWTEWEYQETSYDSTGQLVSDISYLVGIIAAIFDLPKTDNIVVDTANYILSKYISVVYITRVRYMRFSEDTTSCFQEKYVTTIYENSNYTGEIKSNTIIYTYCF
ncbi:hypothetical protein [Sedimentibacter sp.]|uniref:hypothetical protein n=1 Tax=Sedimentibacter sp. TaxID=1960295 RepID=UPI0028988D31|nr:hypothetical protein [Sedimentibacter sp.]